MFDNLTTPPKNKWFCCVCVAENWFLRINTEPRHHGFNLLIQRNDNPMMDHDSYLDCRGVIVKDRQIIQTALENPANYKGRLSNLSISRLAEHIKSVPTIPQIHKAKILSELTLSLSPNE